MFTFIKIGCIQTCSENHPFSYILCSGLQIYYTLFTTFDNHYLDMITQQQTIIHLLLIRCAFRLYCH